MDSSLGCLKGSIVSVRVPKRQLSGWFVGIILLQADPSQIRRPPPITRCRFGPGSRRLEATQRGGNWGARLEAQACRRKSLFGGPRARGWGGRGGPAAGGGCAQGINSQGAQNQDRAGLSGGGNCRKNGPKATKKFRPLNLPTKFKRRFPIRI